MLPPSAVPVPHMGWRASCRSLPTHVIEAVEAGLGSRPSALLRVSLHCLVSTATAKPEPNVRSLPSQNVGSLSMQDQLSLLCVENRERILRPGSPPRLAS